MTFPAGTAVERGVFLAQLEKYKNVNKFPSYDVERLNVRIVVSDRSPWSTEKRLGGKETWRAQVKLDRPRMGSQKPAVRGYFENVRVRRYADPRGVRCATSLPLILAGRYMDPLLYMSIVLYPLNCNP